VERDSELVLDLDDADMGVPSLRRSMYYGLFSYRREKVASWDRSRPHPNQNTWFVPRNMVEDIPCSGEGAV
jgi:hypothetical protein